MSDDEGRTPTTCITNVPCFTRTGNLTKYIYHDIFFSVSAYPKLLGIFLEAGMMVVGG